MSNSPLQHTPGATSKVTVTPIKDNSSKDVLLISIKKIEDSLKEVGSSYEKPNSDIAGMNERSFSTLQKSRDNLSVTDPKPVSVKIKHKKRSATEHSSNKPRKKDQSKNSDQPNISLCAKHGAIRLNRKKSEITPGSLSLCEPCSKSMLSYIFLVQDFLDSLAWEITSNESSPQCIECLREDLSSKSLVESDLPHSKGLQRSRSSEEASSSFRDEQSSSRSEKHEQVKVQRRRVNSKVKDIDSSPTSSKSSEDAGVFPSSLNKSFTAVDVPVYYNPVYEENINENETYKKSNISVNNFVKDAEAYLNVQKNVGDNSEKGTPSVDAYRQNVGVEYPKNSGNVSSQNNNENLPSAPLEYYSGDRFSQYPLQHDKKETSLGASSQYNQEENFTDRSCDMGLVTPTALFNDGIFNVVPPFSNSEREIYDAARDKAGWEGPIELQEQGISQSNAGPVSEAFVTIARNNAEAFGCLVLGVSLRNCGTSKTLCVLLTDGVSNAFRDPLSSVFQEIKYIRSLDSLGTTRIALLEQPDLGIFFDKLNVWRLTQFTKCVYLNPDTIVVKNCDELFGYEELSAVPDIGWPDCFNSGIFVFVPSVYTFKSLLECAEKQESCDGGDQTLLNTYFQSWSSDINKKLSFIYNLMANVSYTYTPAFQQFGQNVKVVQFLGSYKPWHVKFITDAGQIDPVSQVHPTYVQFVKTWGNIFCTKILELFPQDVQLHVASQKMISAAELLRFFPSPPELESDYLLTPPSARLRLNEKREAGPGLTSIDHRRRRSTDFLKSKTFQQTKQYSADDLDARSPAFSASSSFSCDVLENENKSKVGNSDVQEQTLSLGVEEELKLKSSVASPVASVAKKNTALPGADIGDYQGMQAWEQGRMDYEGCDRSDNIINRIRFLMSQSNN